MSFSMYVGISAMQLHTHMDEDTYTDEQTKEQAEAAAFRACFIKSTPLFMEYSHYEYELPLVVGKFYNLNILQN